VNSSNFKIFIFYVFISILTAHILLQKSRTQNRHTEVPDTQYMACGACFDSHKTQEILISVAVSVFSVVLAVFL